MQFGTDELPDELLRSCKSITVLACGSAMHAGMVAKYVIERMCRVKVDVEVASEFRGRKPILGPDDLVVVISQSGETIDTLGALKLAKSCGSKVLSIVNVVASLHRPRVGPCGLYLDGARNRRCHHQGLLGPNRHSAT